MLSIKPLAFKEPTVIAQSGIHYLRSSIFEAIEVLRSNNSHLHGGCVNLAQEGMKKKTLHEGMRGGGSIGPPPSIFKSIQPIDINLVCVISVQYTSN